MPSSTMVKLYLIVEIQFYCSWLLLYLSGDCCSVFLERITVNNQHVKTHEDWALMPIMNCMCSIYCMENSSSESFSFFAAELIGSVAKSKHGISCILFPLGDNSTQKWRFGTKAAVQWAVQWEMLKLADMQMQNLRRECRTQTGSADCFYSCILASGCLVQGSLF